MKKWLKSLAVIAAVVLVLLPCVLFSACSGDHTPAVGDTYVFESLNMQWADGVSDEIKESNQQGNEKDLKDSKFVFISKDEVKIVMSGETVKYSIKDGKVVMTNGEISTEMTIKGNTLVMEMPMDDIVCTAVIITYKLS